MTKFVTIPLETAKLIRTVFLPANPRKLRTAHPDTVNAVNDFIEALHGASPPPSDDARDAARYRWLREQSADAEITVECMNRNEDGFYHLKGVGLDSAIDKRLAVTKSVVRSTYCSHSDAKPGEVCAICLETRHTQGERDA